jgi:hypothetical protein
MSALYDLRDALADAIIAANIGWTSSTVIIKRQSDLWNDIATAIATSSSGAALHIGVAEGSNTGKHSRGLELSIPLTIVCQPSLTAGATPEEDLWEDLIDFVTGLKLPGDLHSYSEFQIVSFSDIEVQTPDGGTPWMGRQTVFKKFFLF